MVKLLRAKIEEVKGAAQAKHDEYWQAELAWREQRAVERQRRDAEYQAQRAERDAAYKARMAELAGEPFHQEVHAPARSSILLIICLRTSTAHDSCMTAHVLTQHHGLVPCIEGQTGAPVFQVSSYGGYRR